jgi:methylenetetrahydrofolate reductase (NADPH)
MGHAQRVELSFEFFPPKTPQGEDKLHATQQQLAALAPAYVSVTYGAGGSTQEGTFRTVAAMARHGHQVASHFSCIGASPPSVRQQLQALLDQGISRLVALRGDLPSGYGSHGAFAHAVDLVRFVRAEFGQAFHVSVAAYPEVHPQASSAQADLQAFADKVKAGADGAITQYFFNTDAYFRMVDDAYALGVEVPIVPGIMPITSSTQLLRFSDACGAEIPRWIRRRLMDFGDDTASIQAFGLDVVTDLCDQLCTAGVPGLHFYTMNQSAPVLAIGQRLGWLATP